MNNPARIYRPARASKSFRQATGPAPTRPPANTGTSAASSSSGIFTAAASVINNAVNGLFQNKVYKSQAELLKAQKETELLRARLMQLDQEQQAVLAARLQELTDDNAKAKLLNDMSVAIIQAQLNSTAYDVNAIYIAGLQSTGAGSSLLGGTSTNKAADNQIKLAVIVLVSAVIVVAAAIFFKKQNN